MMQNTKCQPKFIWHFFRSLSLFLSKIWRISCYRIQRRWIMWNNINMNHKRRRGRECMKSSICQLFFGRYNKVLAVCAALMCCAYTTHRIHQHYILYSLSHTVEPIKMFRKCQPRSRGQRMGTTTTTTTEPGLRHTHTHTHVQPDTRSTCVRASLCDKARGFLWTNISEEKCLARSLDYAIFFRRAEQREKKYNTHMRKWINKM